MAWEELALRALGIAVNTLGDEVAYIPAGGSAITLSGIFEERHQAVDPDTGVPFYCTNPMLTVAIADLPLGCPRPGDAVERKGKHYRVTGGQPDGDGGTMLELKS